MFAPFSLCFPRSALFWSDIEIRRLEGCACNAKAQRLQEQTTEDFAKLKSAILSLNPGNAALAEEKRMYGATLAEIMPRMLTLDSYKWALATVWSRFMDFPTGEGGTVRIGVPFADMFNHSHEARVVHQSDPEANVVRGVAAADYEVLSSLLPSLTHALAASLVCSVPSLPPTLSRCLPACLPLSPSLPHSLPHSLTLSFPPSLTYSLTHSLTHSATPSLTNSLNNSLNHSLTQ